MTISKRDVQKLKDKIAADRKKLEEQEAALRIVENMLNEASTTVPTIIVQAPAAASKKKKKAKSVRSKKPHVPLDPNRKPFNSTVKEIIATQFMEREFTVQNIFDVLAGRNEIPAGQSPKARIAMALNLLEKKGQVERTHKGFGPEPHRFAVKRMVGTGPRL